MASLAATVGLTDVTGDWIIHPAGEPERVIAPPADVFRTRHITTLPEGWVGLLPVRWRGDRYGYDKIVSRADIGTQLDEPCIRRTWNGEEEIVDLPMAPLKDDKPDLDQVTSVTTSREYLELAEQGMISAYWDFVSDSILHEFRMRSDALKLLRQLKPSSESHVDSFVLGRDALSHLPKHWFSNRSWEKEALDRLNAGVEMVLKDEYDWGFYLKYRNPWDIALYTVSDPGEDEFVEQEAGYWFDTQVLAWGDANGDGFEDLVVEFCLTWKGSRYFRWGGIHVLTRFDEHDRLHHVADCCFLVAETNPD